MIIEQLKNKYITGGGWSAMLIWLTSIILLILLDADMEFMVFWLLMGSVGIFLYCFSFYSLIPQALNKKRPLIAYLFRAFVVVVISFLPAGYLSSTFIPDDETAFTIVLFNGIAQMFIIVPISWILFKRHSKGNEELYDLKKELGQSNANLDFLRSQINPHFLFNALNTIYGMAIRENAEKTGESIGKLGEMMHFMLSENLQTTILLEREIEYLKNYIDLQQLRTDNHPNIQVTTEILTEGDDFVIAPMLLIPFVENAYKHGISFREPSQISITLEVKGSTLYFDVYNSKHKKNDNDPEKHKGGVGMNNVKQRLKLLYPNSHELSVRETGIGFFVHLTVQLAKAKPAHNKKAVNLNSNA